MSALGVLRLLEGGRVGFMCPGCREIHQIHIRPAPSPSWDFNGDYDRPTFSPSILVNGVQTEIDERGEWTGEWICGPDGEPLPLVCHSFVRDGQIQFLNDCTHALAGQTVPLQAVATD